MPEHRLPRIAIATGDPAGIGPEVSLKAALDAGVRRMCRPLLVGDQAVLRRHAQAAGISAPIRVVADASDAPAIVDAQAAGVAVAGPFGCDTMFQRREVDAFVVMLHDQGHIPAKLLAPQGAAALTIGTPILFSSVAHGCAYDIAGKGVANPQAMIEAIARLAYPGPDL